MVKVPTLDSPDIQLKPARVNPNTAATLGGEVVDISEGLGAVADHLQKVQNATDVRNGLTGFTQDSINIHNEIFKESDLSKSSDKAQGMLQKSLDARANQIKNPEARQAFLNRANSILDRNFTSINSMIAVKTAQQSRTSLKDYGDNFVSTYADLSRPDQMKSAIDDFSREVDVNVQNGTTPKWMADEYKKQYIYKAQYTQASHDIDLNPQMALKQLKAGDNGMHPNLTTTDRDKLINQAENRIQRNKEKSDQLLKIGQKKNLDDAVMKNTMGLLTNEKAEEMFYKKQISLEGYNSLIKNGVSPYVINAKTDPEKYLDSIKMLLDPKVSEDKKRTSLLDMNSAGNLETADMKHLYQLHLIPSKNQDVSLSQTPKGKKDLELLDKAQKDDDQLRERGKSLQGMFDRVMGHSDDPKNVSDILQKLHGEISKEQNITPDIIEKKTTEVLNKDNMNKNPRVVHACPKDGSICMDGQGNKARVFPDGRIEAI